jgi:hypothetical protein
MRAYGKFVLSTLVAGFLVVAPIYLAALLLLKALKSLIGLVQPIAKMLPEWLPAEQFLALLLILILCFLTGVGIRTRIGPRDLGANREVLVPENPWLRTVSKPGSANGGGK